MTVTTTRDYGWITDEIREGAVKAVLAGLDTGLSLSAACARVAMTLEVHANTVRNWVVGSGHLEARQRSSSDALTRLAAEIESLRVANSELLAQVKDKQARG